MALPTLPVIGAVPSVGFFQALEWLALGVVWALLTAAVVSSATQASSTQAFPWTVPTSVSVLCHSPTYYSLGIAVAAALGLAKVVIVGVTIFVKVTEGFLKLTKNPPRKLQKVCCRNRVSRLRAILIYSILSRTFLLIVSVIAPLSGLIYAAFDADSPVLYKLYYLAYTFLPLLISGPLVVITYLVKTHCDKGEYISFPAHQRSPAQRDWDVESEASVTEREHDEANTGGERNIINSEPPDPCELDVESGSDGEHGEATNDGESCDTNGEVPNETQEISVQFHEGNSSTE